MKFYLDFEATQFCQRIISIGAIAENGNKFHTYVQLSGKDKLSSFIKKMTGITKEMLAEQGVTADEAFLNFFTWVTENSTGKSEFYCYGDCDTTFLKNTIGKMENIQAIVFATFLQNNLIDYSKKVKSFFQCQTPFGLKKMYNFLKEEEVEQHHDALEDAEMLAFVIKEFDKCRPEDKEVIAAIPSGSNERPRAPQRFIDWPKDKYAADTGANKDTDWAYKAVIGKNEKYFDSIDTVVMWIIRYMVTGYSIKKEEHKNKVKNKIFEVMNSDKLAYNCQWIENKEVEE